MPNEPIFVPETISGRILFLSSEGEFKSSCLNTTPELKMGTMGI